MDNNKSKGVSVLGVIQIVLIILKLCKLINISWWLVFIPSYISLFLMIVILVLTVICLISQERND